MWQRVSSCRRGAAAVEFALLMPIFVIFLLGFADLGVAVFNKMELMSATRAGAQLALLDSTETTAIRQAVVDSSTTGLTLDDVTADQSCKCADGTDITCGDTCGDGSDNRIFMTIFASQDVTLNFISTTVNVDGSATIRIQ